jgi:outer membrane protein TolC
LLAFFTVKSYAQETIISDINQADLEKYIQLAKQNVPKRKILMAKNESLKAAIPQASLSYLDLFSASYFYRPSDKLAISPTNPYIVNGIQYGISLNLGSFLQKPFAVKKAKQDYKVAQLEEQDYDIQLALEVKKRYYDYIQTLAMLKINSQSAIDSKGVAESLRYKFEKAEITLDTYNQSRVAQTTSLTAKIQSEVAYLRAKDLLEEMIGQKISDVK